MQPAWAFFPVGHTAHQAAVTTINYCCWRAPRVRNCSLRLASSKIINLLGGRPRAFHVAEDHGTAGRCFTGSAAAGRRRRRRGGRCVRARARVGVRAVRGSGRQRQASLRSDQVLSRDRGKAVVLLRSRHDAAAAIEARRGGGERRPTVTLLPLPGRVAPPPARTASPAGGMGTRADVHRLI
jgi:hypothetical protein